MRTTLNIEDDSILLLKNYAQERNLSLGQAASDLILRGVQSLPKFEMRNGFALLETPPGAPVITSQMVDDWEQEDMEQEFQHALSPRR